MPIIKFSTYGNFLHFLRNGHIDTIIPNLFSTVSQQPYQRERIETPDDDFLDLDWIHHRSDKLLVLSHGLEGHSHRPYMLSMANYFSLRGFDILAWNYRSCSGEMNLQPRLYHHGVTDDLETVIHHAAKFKKYKKIALVGFSMGGSTNLKFLGEKGKRTPKSIVASVSFSVPCHLWDSALQLTSWQNHFYQERFLRKLIAKIKLKHAQFPDLIHLGNIDEITTFGQFDEQFTAPLHGFKNARHFYKTSTSDLYYENIKVPSLIVNALNDPMLGELCYPYELCKAHQYLFLETPRCGGHVGFQLFGKKHNWMDQRAYQFISKFTE